MPSETITRRNISELMGLALKLRKPRMDARALDAESIEYQAWRDRHVLLCRVDNGQVVATVMLDDIFDCDGNRFNGDI